MMLVIDHAAIAAALNARPGRQYSVQFEMHVVVHCPEMCGVAEPEVQLPYRAWYLPNYSERTGDFDVLVTRIEENLGSKAHPSWLADQMPRAARVELQKLIAKALNEQAAIDATVELS